MGQVNSRAMYVPPKHVSLEAYVEYLAQAEAESIHGAGRWAHEVIRRASGTAEEGGDRLPWSKTFGDFRLRPSEVTIWGGYRGHMKSFVTGMVAAWLARDVRIGIASFEMPPGDTLWRMACQCAGTTTPSPQWVADWIEAMDPMVRIYDQNSTPTPQRVLAVIHHLAHDLGCAHVFIDSLMKCGIAPDDYNGQKAFIDELTHAAKRYGIHIHLIAHLRKAHHKGGLPGADDVSGGSDITNLADNVVIVWNDKALMELRAKERAGFPLSADECQRIDERTHILKLEKQRRGPDQQCWALWFHDRSTQFLPENRRQCMDWIPEGSSLARMRLEARTLWAHEPQMEERHAG